MDWTGSVSDGRIYIECRGDDIFSARICALEPASSWSKYLMPVRVLEGGRATDDPFSRSLEAHVDGLQEKIRAIDRLKLSQVEFAEAFGSARMIVEAGGADARHEELESCMWSFAHEVLEQLADRLPLPVLSQIDYDQKRLHEQLGATLDSMDFAVRHDPSAIATVRTFLAVLEHRGVAAADALVSVTGVGDLGSRLVSRFLNAGVRKVFVADGCIDRLEVVASRDRVEAMSLEDIRRSECHAQVLSADKSFSPEVADAWAGTERLIVVGGPEAGLDRFRDERALLARHGKEFVPSVLCGSLGLVSNLEEGIGHVPDLIAMEARFDRLLSFLVPAAGEQNGLAERCEMLLRGGLQFD